jgi:hypothetical protein
MLAAVLSSCSTSELTIVILQFFCLLWTHESFEVLNLKTSAKYVSWLTHGMVGKGLAHRIELLYSKFKGPKCPALDSTANGVLVLLLS